MTEATTMTPAPAPAWQTAFRDGLAPLLPVKGLRALATALRANSEHLLQKVTVLPRIENRDDRDADVVHACPLAFTLWKGTH